MFMNLEQDRKLLQLKLQHEISIMLHQDNGVSCHFDYHINLNSELETIKLNLLTYNPKHNEYMLFHTVKGSSSIDCLEKLKTYITDHLKSDQLKSYTLTWYKKKSPQAKNKSYFFAISESDAIGKFLHEKDAQDYYFEIYQNPLS